MNHTTHANQPTPAADSKVSARVSAPGPRTANSTGSQREPSTGTATHPQIEEVQPRPPTSTGPTLAAHGEVQARVSALAVTNPRQQRALLALLAGPVSREQLDRITGASNSPNVIHRLRCKGFEIPCSSTEATDRDGRPCHPGAYSLTDADRVRALALLADWREVQP